MRLLTVLTALALGATPVLADCKRVVAAKHHAVKAVVVEPKVALAVVYAPLVAVGYAAPYAVPQGAYAPSSLPAPAGVPGAGASPADVQALAVQVQQLTAEVQRLRQSNGTPPGGSLPLQAPADPATALFSARCARCHDASKAEKEGGGFVLLAGGKVPDLNLEQLLKVSELTHAGQMPPEGPNLSREELKLVQAFVRSRIKPVDVPGKPAETPKP